MFSVGSESGPGCGLSVYTGHQLKVKPARLFIIGVDNLGRQGCRPKPAHGIVFVFKSRQNVPYLKLITFIDNPAAFLTFTVLNASFVESQNVFIATKDTSDMLSSVLPSSPACQLRT